MSTRAWIGVGLLAGLGAWLGSLAGGGAEAPSPTAGVGTPLGGPGTCLPCHAQVVEEWRLSMHAMSFTDPQVRAPDQSDNFRRQECLPCHAPRPIFEHGIVEGTRALARVERRADGVDCLSCHAVGGGVAASRSGLQGACQPTWRAELSTHLQCAPCHNQHNTHDEWMASPAAEAGLDCLACHMPRVTRGADEAGGPRAGRSHRFLGGRDREYALAGLELAHDWDPATRRLDVSLTNAFAGHNLPTDSRNRALDLVVTLYDALGAPFAPQPGGEEREPGAEPGTARRRFRNPYRSQGKPNSQLPAGRTARLAVDVPPQAVRAVIELIYKLAPYVGDDEAHWRHRVDVDLR